MPFELCAQAGRAYRFPPTIGALNSAPLLYVGINSRISDSNRSLHDSLMRDYLTFQNLAANRHETDRPYIGVGGEPHYTRHRRTAQEIFPQYTFEAVAAVTELFFCASSSASGLPITTSQCAKKYLDRVIRWVRPMVIFTVGQKVKEYIDARYRLYNQNSYINVGNDHDALVVFFPHPNARGEKISGWNAATEIARERCRGAEEKYGLT
jgi:hypothetical protein